jgi:hypothetical protein
VKKRNKNRRKNKNTKEIEREDKKIMKTRDISQGITGVGVSRVGGKKNFFQKEK